MLYPPEPACRRLLPTYNKAMQTNKQTILIVEDEARVAHLERRVLEGLGYEVVISTDAEDGYRQLQVTTPTAIILDIGLPGQSGLSLAEQIHKDSKTLTIPIIFVTAKSAPTDLVEGFAAGARLYLTKPFTERALSMAIQTLLGGDEGE